MKKRSKKQKPGPHLHAIRVGKLIEFSGTLQEFISIALILKRQYGPDSILEIWKNGVVTLTVNEVQCNHEFFWWSKKCKHCKMRISKQ